MADESQQQYTYAGSTTEVVWDGRLCIHVGECTRARGDLFESGRQPWCEPDRADADVVAAVIERCPTGALSYNRSDGGASEPVPDANSITVANNGPLYARGELAIEGAPENAPGLRRRAALCRCGLSANKPFCDNSHEGADFRDRGPIGDVGDRLEAHGGRLSIRPRPNGPLLIEGNLTIISGHGLPTWTGTRALLCRCGESANKPFCDGTHKRIGFKTDEGAAVDGGAAADARAAADGGAAAAEGASADGGASVDRGASVDGGASVDEGAFVDEDAAADEG